MSRISSWVETAFATLVRSSPFRRERTESTMSFALLLAFDVRRRPVRVWGTDRNANLTIVRLLPSGLRSSARGRETVSGPAFTWQHTSPCLPSAPCSSPFPAILPISQGRSCRSPQWRTQRFLPVHQFALEFGHRVAHSPRHKPDSVAESDHKSLIKNDESVALAPLPPEPKIPRNQLLDRAFQVAVNPQLRHVPRRRQHGVSAGSAGRRAGSRRA